MKLHSMTGFARAVAEHEGTAIAWEVKSVNGKGVEVRLRLPPAANGWSRRRGRPCRSASRAAISRRP
jgi:uncharacterized protein YicC (UPF0701 family)